MRLATKVAWLVVGGGVSAMACAESVPPAVSTHAEPPRVVSVVAADAGVVDAAGGAPDAATLATLDALAARAASVAAGMREVGRGEITGDATGATRVVARADDRDACVRVTLVARNATGASLVDARGDVLGDTKDASDATLGARGPVCVRKGDAVSLRVEASGAFVARFVAWESP